MTGCGHTQPERFGPPGTRTGRTAGPPWTATWVSHGRCHGEDGAKPDT